MKAGKLAGAKAQTVRPSGRKKRRASKLRAAVTTRGQTDTDTTSLEPRDSGETVKHSPPEVLSTEADG